MFRMFLQNNCKGIVKEIFYVSVAMTIYLLVGINRTYLAFLFYQLDAPNSLITMDDDQKSWAASFMSILSPIGCLISGIFMDTFGRKPFIQFIYIPFIVSWLVIILAKNAFMLYIGIMIQSISGGMSFCIATYVAEISLPNHRGALLSVLEITYSLGILFCNILMYFLEWKSAAFIFEMISVAGLVLTLFLPESPVWLYSRSRCEKSIKTLCSIRCQEQTQIQSEIDGIIQSCSTELKIYSKRTLINCLKSWKPLLTLSCMFIILQNTGYPMMLAFSVTIIDRLQIPFKSSDITLLFSLSIFIGSLTTPYFMHKFGRKTILTISGFGMGISMIVLGIYEELINEIRNNSYSWIVPAILCSYIFACIIGVLPIGFIMGGELFPIEVRGIMNGLYGSIGYLYWAAMFKAYPHFLNYFGVKVSIWAFASFSFLAGTFGIFILPETKGKSLNEVQQTLFNKRNNDFKIPV